MGSNCTCGQLPPAPRRMTAHLPGAESLEEEEESKAPDHGGAGDAQQGDEFDPFSAAELRVGVGKGRAA